MRQYISKKASALAKTIKRGMTNTEPFVVAETVLLGQRMKLITHRQDRVLGAMLRGDMNLCQHYQAELAWLKEQIRPGDSVLDVGGNMGSVSIALSLAEPKAFICTFEPDPLNYGMFQLNLALNGCGNVSAFNLALGDTEGVVDFYNSPDNFGDHRSSKPKGIDLRESEFVRLSRPVFKVKASRFLEQCFAGRKFDLVKIDTQGADFEILGDILSLLKPDAKVAIEFSPYHLETNGTTENQVFDLLSAFRSIQRIEPRPQHSYGLVETDCAELRKFYSEQCKRYRTYYDLVLI